MATMIQVRAALGAMFLAAVIIGHAAFEWTTIALVLFGAFNLIVPAPGTGWVRGTTVACVVAALVWKDVLLVPVALLAWLVWPPAYMVAWATGRQALAFDEPRGPRAVVTGPRVTLAATIAAVAIASILYRQVAHWALEQTAALFVGVPALLAIVVVFAVSPRSAVGVACKAVTIGLLTSLVFLWEGVLCVLMSAPLFYAVAVYVTGFIAHTRTDYDNPQSWVSCIALLAVVPMSLEGVSDRTSLNRHEEVTVTRTVTAGAQEVERALFEPPRFDRAMPLYLRAGFPRPVSTRVERSNGPSRWVVRLRGGEMKLNGMEPRAGDLVLELVESRPGFLRWRAVSDDSHMTHFLSWEESTVEWQPAGDGNTQVTWTLRYRRGLDPAWYFGPWQRYAAGLAARYRVDAVATP